MKLTPLHMFIALLLGMLLCSVCNHDYIVEGLANKREDRYNEEARNSTHIANPLDLDEGDRSPQALIHGGHHEHPLGIPRSQIPNGDDDLYILKSEIVPPVCPACPTTSVRPRQEPCAPCPPCGRCPEPAFDCKKVPNYRNNGDMYLPRPVLADFSQFGM